MGLKDRDEGQGLLHGAILLAPMVTIKDEMKPPQVHVCACAGAVNRWVVGSMHMDG